MQLYSYNYCTMEKAEFMIKKRLDDLKRLSENLKQSTEAANQIDLTLIKAIFDMTKTNPNLNTSASSPKLHDRSSSSIGLPLQSKMSKKSSFLIPVKHEGENDNAQTILNEQNIEPLFPEKKSLKTIPSSTKIALQKASQHQLIHLHEQNCKLQFQVRELKEKLRQYQNQAYEKQTRLNETRSNQGRSPDQRGSSSPYFQFSEEVELFFTKLTVDKEDYKKVEYELLPLKLTLDKVIMKKEKLSPSKSNKSLSSWQTERDENSVQLNLSQLREVQYEEDTGLVLSFSQGQSANRCKLFLLFDSKQSRHRWDLGIFVNSKIINNLGTYQLFEQEKRIQMQRKQEALKEQRRFIEREMEKQQNSTLTEKQLLIRLTYYKQKYAQAHTKLKQLMLNKISQNKKSMGSIDAISDVDKNNYAEPSYQLQSRELPAESPNSESKKVGQTQGISSSLSKAENDTHKIQQQHEAQKEKFKKVEVEKQIEQEKQQERQREREKEKQKVEKAKNFMKKGIFMTKYSKSAFKPHEKRVFINIDSLKFCWEDKDSKQIKTINISDIQSIEEGEIGEGVKKHVNEKKLKNKSSFLLINTKLKDRKTLQFSAASADILGRFTENYQILYSQIQKGNLKPKK